MLIPMLENEMQKRVNTAKESMCRRIKMDHNKVQGLVFWLAQLCPKSTACCPDKMYKCMGFKIVVCQLQNPEYKNH